MNSDGAISEFKENFVDEFIEHEETFVDEMKKVKVFYVMYILCYVSIVLLSLVYVRLN